MGSIDGLLSDCNWLKRNIEVIMAGGIQAAGVMATLNTKEDAYSVFVMNNQLDIIERLLIQLSLTQYTDPELCHRLVTENNVYRLVQCHKTGLLLPTGETFLRLVSGNDMKERVKAHNYLSTVHLFYRKSVITLGDTGNEVAQYYGVLNLAPTYKELFLYNRYNSPRFNKDFPAHLLETHLNWSDLIINPSTAERLDEIKAFLDYSEILKKEWGLSKHMKNGYRCLFYGPSGTGKTLAATLLGKYVNCEVYRVDLSAVISKYVGETSKNLNTLFNIAEDKNWILFFDEGDALFGKRIDTGQADDKNSYFANQDIAFLLQRIENYNGLVIVASNFKKNMDDAFSRRFQSIVYFDLLNSDLRKQYWIDNMPKAVSLEPGLDIDHIAKTHLLSPASIVNVINRISLQTISRDRTEISRADLELCIKDELLK